MKICLDARSPGRSGVFTYISALLRHLAKLNTGHEYVVLRTPKDKEWGIQGLEERVIPSSNPLHWYLWSNTQLPKILERERFDLYHSLKHITMLRGNTKKVVTFHSARFLIYPEHYKWYDASYWKLLSPPAARQYDAVITHSEAEKRNYVDRMGSPEEKFHAISLAADPRFGVIDDRDRLEEVRSRYDLPERFLLYVGRMIPVKNIETLLRAYRHAKDLGGIEHKLVLVGWKSWHSGALESLAADLKITEDALFVGPITEDLPAVYNLADLFLLVSHYEALGTVPLEAMACGTPVITSDRGGLPEAVGDAGLVVPADDAEKMGRSIIEVLSSEERRKSMSERGLARCSGFSWTRCARETNAVYEELVRG